MYRSRSPLLILTQIVLFFLCLVGLIWANYHFVLTYSPTSEFSNHWAIFRSFITKGSNPYSLDTWKAAEALLNDQSIHIQNKITFSFPIYAAIVFLPFALIPNLIFAEAIWMFFLELCLLSLAIVGTQLFTWKPGRWNWFLILFYCFLGLPAFQALVKGDLIIVVSLLLAASIISLRLEWDELAGLAFAVATMVPGNLLIIGLFILFWVISKRRWRFLVWFFFSLGVMIVIGLFFLPNWLMQYLQVLINSQGQIAGITPYTVFMTWWPGIGRQLTWIFTIILLILMLTEWFLALGKEFNWFLWTFCLTLTLGQWLGIPTEMENNLILTLPLILILATWDERIPGKGRWLPIIGQIFALVSLWGIFINKLFTVPSNTIPASFLFPLPFIILVCLYWIRWWCVRPQKLGLDELRSYEAHR